MLPPPPTNLTAIDEWEVYYTCQCKGAFQSGGMCSHILLMRHLEGDIDLDRLTQKISAPRMRGRPTKALKALQKEPAESYTPKPSFYVGAGFAKIFPKFHSEPFLGRVIDIRRPRYLNPPPPEVVL